MPRNATQLAPSNSFHAYRRDLKKMSGTNIFPGEIWVKKEQILTDSVDIEKEAPHSKFAVGLKVSPGVVRLCSRKMLHERF